jgi:hypothetical protein
LAENLFKEVDPSLRVPARSGVWSEAIRTLETPGRTIFVEKKDANRAKGSLVQAMRSRKLRLRSQVTTVDEVKGVLFWTEPIPGLTPPSND